MDIEALLRGKLIESLGEVDKVDVVSEGGSCSAAAKVIVTVVSKKFEGASRLQRHRIHSQSQTKNVSLGTLTNWLQLSLEVSKVIASVETSTITNHKLFRVVVSEHTVLR